MINNVTQIESVLQALRGTMEAWMDTLLLLRTNKHVFHVLTYIKFVAIKVFTRKNHDIMNTYMT